MEEVSGTRALDHLIKVANKVDARFWNPCPPSLAGENMSDAVAFAIGVLWSVETGRMQPRDLFVSAPYTPWNPLCQGRAMRCSRPS